MLNWLEHTLGDDEEVIFQTRSHKYMFILPPVLIFLSWLSIYFLIAGLVNMGYVFGKYFYYEYVITSDRVILKKGLFYIRLEEIPIYDIEDVLIRRSLYDRITNGGTVFIFAESTATQKLKNLDRPGTFRSALYSQIPATTMSYYEGV